MVPYIFLCIFAGLLLWAAVADLATMEIPNRISILLVVIFPIAALASGMSWTAMGVHLFVGVVALAVCYILFQMNVFGGGDAKVLAAASVWVGLSALPHFLLWTALAGGVLSAAAIAVRATAKPTENKPAFLNRLLDPTGGVPYAVAIAAGGLAALPLIPLTSG